MKTLTLFRTLLVGAVFAGGFVSNALANHRTGDFPLPELVLPGDFNEDGKIDLAVNVVGFDNFVILEGDGLGGFTLKRHIETDTLPKGLAVGDMNRDGHLDIVSLAEWGYSLKINAGNGKGGFTFATETNGDGDPTRVLLGDVNNDGNLDTIANAPAEGNLIIYLGDGKGGLSNSPIEIEDDIRNNFGLATADFNHDGNLDIAVTRYGNPGPDGSHLRIYLGDGKGGFTISTDIVVNPAPVTIEVGDLNKDGNLDLVIGGAGPENTTGNFVSTVFGDGAGGFTIHQTIDLGPGSLGGDIGVADFNEDGNLDVAFPVDTTQSDVPSTSVLTFYGDSAGNLTAGPTLTVGIEPHSVLAMDLNKDGHVDLAVTNRTDATLSVLLGDGKGGFTTHAVIPVAVTPSQ